MRRMTREGCDVLVFPSMGSSRGVVVVRGDLTLPRRVSWVGISTPFAFTQSHAFKFQGNDAN